MVPRLLVEFDSTLDPCTQHCAIPPSHDFRLCLDLDELDTSPKNVSILTDSSDDETAIERRRAAEPTSKLNGSPSEARHIWAATTFGGWCCDRVHCIDLILTQPYNQEVGIKSGENVPNWPL